MCFSLLFSNNCPMNNEQKIAHVGGDIHVLLNFFFIGIGSWSEGIGVYIVVDLADTFGD